MAVVPGPRVFCSKSINAAFRRFLTILYKGNVLENLKSTYQAFYKLEKYYTIRTLKKSLMFLNRLFSCKKNCKQKCEARVLDLIELLT